MTTGAPAASREVSSLVGGRVNEVMNVDSGHIFVLDIFPIFGSVSRNGGKRGIFPFRGVMIPFFVREALYLN